MTGLSRSDESHARPGSPPRAEPTSHPADTIGQLSEPFQPSHYSRETRIGLNEDWCRTLNERKAEWIARGDLAAGFRCECWRLDCNDRIPLSGREWREVRARPNRFAVAPGHLAPEDETVIRECRRFWIIEKRGEAGGVAEETA
jgi:hypothetical protein